MEMPSEFWREIISNLEFITQPNQVWRPKKKKSSMQDLNLSQESITKYTPSKGRVNPKNYMIHRDKEI